MKFLKKNGFFILAMAFVAVLFLFPSVKLKLKDLFFPIAAIENAITLNDEDYDIQLKGINVSLCLPSGRKKCARGEERSGWEEMLEWL